MSISSAPLPTPARALAIGAHPDDIEFGAGATLARWAEAGCEVSFFICTDGSKGSWNPDEDQPALVARRQREQRAAADAIGVRGEVVFGGWIDGELESGVRQRVQVTAAIRRLRPDVVLGHDPWKRYRLHPDHRHAGLLVTDGIVAARDPLFFPEIAIPPHRPSALLLFEADGPDHLEPTGAAIERKIAALLAHGSQLETTMDFSNAAERAAEETAAFTRRIRDEAAAAGPISTARRRGVQADGRPLGRAPLSPCSYAFLVAFFAGAGFFAVEVFATGAFLAIGATFFAAGATFFAAAVAFFAAAVAFFAAGVAFVAAGVAFVAAVAFLATGAAFLAAGAAFFVAETAFVAAFVAGAFDGVAFFATGAAGFGVAVPSIDTGFAGALRAFRSAFNPMPGVKPIPFDALIRTAAPVWGLRPRRAARSRSLNVPNPVIRTGLPDHTPVVTS